MNPYGKKGCPEHQKKIKEIGFEIERRGLIVFFEFLFRIRGGKKKSRFADVVGFKGNKLTEVHQVGITNANGTPVKRELDAADDIENKSEYKDISVQFHKFSKILLLVLAVKTISLFL
ncbi:MAG TPA: hypothetical protein DCQ31_10870 [Bacteroidales bacterium]|nr:hypothetical protein [Bacteroidales bacterium]